ncbi:MAG: TlpA family protein disulfide reductase [Rhodospirillales bacterium]|nr:TlpA family protein disulfide reductase [Rhodospirillales bacterium]
MKRRIYSKVPTQIYSRILGVFMIGLIFAISSVHARAETSGIEKFQLTEPKKAMPTAPFFENGEIKRTISDYKGKVLVVNFWARWCAPCLKEMPGLDRLEGKMKGEGIAVLPITLDRTGASSAKTFYERIEAKHLPILVDKGRKFVRKLGVSGLPTTLIIDPEGYEVGRLTGPAEWDHQDAIDLIRSFKK